MMGGGREAIFFSSSRYFITEVKALPFSLRYLVPSDGESPPDQRNTSLSYESRVLGRLAFIFLTYITMGTLLSRVTSVVSIGTILASSLATSLVSAASEFLPYAEALADNGIINTQSTEAGYRLSDSITRAEMAKIAVNLAGVEPTGCLGTMYSDVTTSNTLCAYVEAAADAGIVSSAFANFRPSALVTRAEMVKMLLGAVGELPNSMSAGYLDVNSSL